jgi:endonuclease/exonuclease/phosphatase family metal-dependent hydrolase
MWRGNLLENVITFLKEQDADIVVLQEVFNTEDRDLDDGFRSLEILKDKLDYEYFNYAPAFIDSDFENKVEQGNLIFSKFPITNHEVVFLNSHYKRLAAENRRNFPHLPRNLQSVAIESPAGELNVLNFHGVWDLDGDNYSPQRQKMSRIIVEQIKNKQNVILAGDTNATPGNQAIREIEDHLISVFRGDLKTTFNMKHKDNPDYAYVAVDMMFVGRNIEVINKSCLEVDVSDHLPLVATLEI